MISEATKSQGSYQNAFQTLQANGAGPQRVPWIERLRESAMERFEQLGFPAVQEEEWKYTNVAQIVRAGFLPLTATGEVSAAVGEQQLAAFTYPEARASQLVFVDGLLRSELSSLTGLPEGIKAVDFATALASDPFSELLREYLGRIVDYGDNGFTALNTAFIGSGALVVIPKGLAVETPLQLLFLSSSTKANLAAFPRVLVIAEENSSATIIESYNSVGADSYFTNAVVEIVLKDGARLEHYRVQDESTESFHIANTRADLGRNSSYETTSINLGAKLSRHDLSVVMDHEGAECRVDGLYIIGEGQHTDTHSVIDHKQPHCTSHQLYKGILDGKSRAVFNGKVFVRHGALGTDANQTNKNLLLSNEAHVDTKPQLEIFADDVKCAHGAAIGQLDEDELFYLESRGIHSDLARNLLTYGFAEEVIVRIKVESIKTQLDEAVLNRLHARLEA
ncbi:MAG: sufD [Acidobacteria bacterium]|nr:sufD [Acidobacteriota bacterium]